MLTYLLNNYRVFFQDKKELNFPAQITLFVELGPPVLFGMAQGLTRAVFAGGNRVSTMVIDFNRGSQGCINVLKPDEFIGCLQIPASTSCDGSEEYPAYTISLQKNVLKAKCECKNQLMFGGFLYIVRCLAPASLSLELWEPVYVEKMHGESNGRPFSLKIKNYGSLVEVLHPGEVEQRIIKSFENLRAIRSTKSSRLKAALHYFQTSRRLLQAGDTIWEFVTEIILNFAKILEVLFGSSRDNIRAQLKLLGYDENAVELTFIPIMILRSQFDVAHPRLAYPQTIKTPEIAKCISMMESTMSELLKRLFEKYESGTYKLPNDEEMEVYAEKEQSDWDAIDTGIRKRFFGDQSVK